MRLYARQNRTGARSGQEQERNGSTSKGGIHDHRHYHPHHSGSHQGQAMSRARRHMPGAERTGRGGRHFTGDEAVRTGHGESAVLTKLLRETAPGQCLPFAFWASGGGQTLRLAEESVTCEQWRKEEGEHLLSFLREPALPVMGPVFLLYCTDGAHRQTDDLRFETGTAGDGWIVYGTGTKIICAREINAGSADKESMISMDEHQQASNQAWS